MSDSTTTITILVSLISYTDWLTLHLQTQLAQCVSISCWLLDFKCWETFSNCHFHAASKNTNKGNNL